LLCNQAGWIVGRSSPALQTNLKCPFLSVTRRVSPRCRGPPATSMPTFRWDITRPPLYGGAPGCCGTGVSPLPSLLSAICAGAPLIRFSILRLPASEPQPAAPRPPTPPPTSTAEPTTSERTPNDHWSHSMGWGGVWGWDEYAEAVRGFPKLSLLPEHASTHDLLTWSLLTPLVPT
jgi:hypothetical protein